MAEATLAALPVPCVKTTLPVVELSVAPTAAALGNQEAQDSPAVALPLIVGRIDRHVDRRSRKRDRLRGCHRCRFRLREIPLASNVIECPLPLAARLETLTSLASV